MLKTTLKLGLILLCLVLFNPAQAGVKVTHNAKLGIAPVTNKVSPPDTILLKNGETKLVRIVEVNKNMIIYQTEKEDTEYHLLTNEIAKIKSFNFVNKDFNHPLTSDSLDTREVEPNGKGAFDSMLSAIGLNVLFSIIFNIPGSTLPFVIKYLVSTAFSIWQFVNYAKAIKSLKIFEKNPTKFKGKGYPIAVIIMTALSMALSFLVIGILLVSLSLIPITILPLFFLAGLPFLIPLF